jgi:membrane protease YdiL (CAAX protease family)
VTWLIIIVGTPLALGILPIEWLRLQFPFPVPWRDIAVAIAVTLVPIWAMYAVWLMAGWVRIEPRVDRTTRRVKLLRRIVGPWPLAALEEAVFRGILLDQLLRALPAGSAYTALAIIITSAVFAALHFVKKSRRQKRAIWQPAYGLFIVSCLFGLAYVLGGRSLWLPIAVHGAAVFAIEGPKLYVAYHAPSWLIGYPSFPQCGLLGSLVVLVTAVALVLLV